MSMGLDFSKALLPVSTVFQISADEARPVLSSGEAPRWGLGVRGTLGGKRTCYRGLRRLRACGKVSENSLLWSGGPEGKSQTQPGNLLTREGRKCLYPLSPGLEGSKRPLVPPNFNSQGSKHLSCFILLFWVWEGCSACMHPCLSLREWLVGEVETDNEEQRMMAIISRG